MNIVFYLLGLAALLCLLYDRGFISVKNARSMLFVGTIYSARYKSAHGTIRRIVRPAESRVYQLVFSSELSKGSVSMEILDGQKQSLLTLEGQKTAELFMEKGKRYVLVLRLKNADGAHHLDRK